MTASLLFLLLAGLLALVFLTPLDLRLRAKRERTISVDVRASWLFGLVEKKFVAGGGVGERSASDLQTSGPEEEHRSTGGKGRPADRNDSLRKKPAGKKARRRALLAALGTSGFAGRLLRLSGDLFRSLIPREISVRLEGGLGDAASTGMACAAVAALSPGLEQVPHLRIEWFPDFDGQDLTGEAAAHFRLVPARVIWPCARFVCHPTTIRALRAAAREKRR